MFKNINYKRYNGITHVNIQKGNTKGEIWYSMNLLKEIKGLYILKITKENNG